MVSELFIGFELLTSRKYFKQFTCKNNRVAFGFTINVNWSVKSKDKNSKQFWFLLISSLLMELNHWTKLDLKFFPLLSNSFKNMACCCKIHMIYFDVNKHKKRLNHRRVCTSAVHTFFNSKWLKSQYVIQMNLCLCSERLKWTVFCII